MSVSNFYLSDLANLPSDYDVTDLNERIAESNRKFQRIVSVINTTNVVQSNMALDASIDPVAQVGQPVFFNTGTNRFELSRLQIQSSPSGRLYASMSSEAWGIIHKKCASNRADVLLSGLASIDLTASTGQASPSGKFYLTTTAGAMASSPDHSIIVPVLLATGAGQVLFRPWFADTYPRYVPAIVEVMRTVAGTPVNSGNVITITSPNPNVLGWLPANHAVFGGNAPVGAVFGYNWKQDNELSVGWPPVNPAEAKLYIEAGGTTSKGSRVLLGNDGQRLIINEFGIWWMTANASQVPWAIPVDGQPSGTNPLAITPKLVLEADLVVYGSDEISGIGSLDSTVDWLKFVKQGTNNPANVGELALSLDTAEMTSSLIGYGTTSLGPVVDGKFARNYQVSSLRAGNAAVSLNGTIVGGSYVGPVTISVIAARDMDLLPTDTQLFGATTESYAEEMAIGLPASCNTRFVNSYHIPNAVTANSSIVFELWITSQGQLSLPIGLELSTRVFSQPTGSPLALATKPLLNLLGINYTPGVVIPSGQYAKIESDVLTVSGGDLVYLQMARNGLTDGVSAEVHVLKLIGRFVN